jgi:ATP-dependent DNA helicase RecG
MHGRLPADEKDDAMAAFRAGQIDVLVCTTVIEVGVDVPNATVMLVMDADRFGISQLHQLRGRIGRGQHASLCLLFGRKDAVRLTALERESDGFALAEIDLQLRGQGELAGTRQSGEAIFRFAEFPRDNELMERAHRYSRDVFDADPDLTAPEHTLLAGALAALYGDEARAPIRA